MSFLRTFFMIVSLAAAFFAGMGGVSAAKERFPEKLDNHPPGHASMAKPLFQDVIEGGVSDSRYEKLDNNLYKMPSGKIYQYDPATGGFGQVEDVVQVVDGNITYFYRDGRLVRMIQRLYDSNGRYLGYVEYKDYKYGADGRLIGYEAWRYDSKDAATGHGVYSSVYDENGNILKYVYTSYDKDNNVLSTYTLDYQYDDQGRLSAYRMVWNGSGYTYTYDYFNYKYDSEGRVVGMESKLSYNGYEYNYKYAYEYDYAGRTVKSTVSYTDPFGNSSTSVTSNTYDATTGKLVKTQQVSTDSQNNVTTSTYNYDANQRLKDYTIQSKDSSGNVTYETVGTYKTDAAGEITQFQSKTTYSNGSTYDTVYNYQDNQVTDYTTTWKDSSGTQYVSKGVYTRDADGNLSKVTQDTSYSNGATYNTTYNYDKGKITDYTSSYKDGSGGSSTTKGQYTYDASGQLQKVTYDSSSSNGSTQKVVYDYKDNQLTQYTSTYKDSSGGTTTSNGSYDRDSSGNLVKYTQSTSYSNGASYDSVYNYTTNNRISDYTTSYKDSSGATSTTTAKYTWDGYTLSKYEQNTANSNGTTSSYATSYRSDGTLDKSVSVNKDSSGKVTSQYEYSNYEYNTQKRVTKYTYQVTESGTYKRYEYDSFTYDSYGGTTGYKWKVYDSAGNQTGQGQWP